MRITNSMVTANTKTNINLNKMYYDNANTKVATGQKITRPSDDPIVAIRALRLNTSLSELNQYAERNIPDADAWFKTTETALTQTDQVLTNIRYSLNQASSEENNTQSVRDVLEELKQLRNQIYVTGNADDAGRTVFTGYRTSEELTFQEVPEAPDPTKPDVPLTYTIYEPISASDIESIQYVKGTQDFDKNTDPTAMTYEEQDVSLESVTRIRLAYDNLESGQTPQIGTKVEPDGSLSPTSPSLIDFDVISITGLSQEEIDKVYTLAGKKSVFIPETGELLLTADDKKTFVNTSGIMISYEKSNWQKGDLRPEHYFMCKSNEPSTLYPDGIEYNFNRVDDTTGKASTSQTGTTITGFKEQDIVYEIAFGQSIQINTHANDVYFHDMGRDIDELTSITQSVLDCETKVAAIDSKLSENPDDAKLQSIKKAIDKEYTMLKEKMHNMYENAIESFKGYQNTLNKEISRIGAMTQRLDLTKNRVEDQQSNVEELADKNINIDLDEIGLDYTSAKTALEAARLAAGQIAESTLLNYI